MKSCFYIALTLKFLLETSHADNGNVSDILRKIDDIADVKRDCSRNEDEPLNEVPILQFVNCDTPGAVSAFSLKVS